MYQKMRKSSFSRFYKPIILIIVLATLSSISFAEQCIHGDKVYVPPASFDMEPQVQEVFLAIQNSPKLENLKPTERNRLLIRNFNELVNESTKDLKSQGECNAAKVYLALLAKKLDDQYGTSLSKRYVLLSRDAYEAKTIEGFQKNLRVGSKVMMCNSDNVKLIGLVIEVKKPIAYVQWENRSVEPRIAWISVGNLLPPQGRPSDKQVTDDDIVQEALRQNRGDPNKALKRLNDKNYRQGIFRDLVADAECLQSPTH